MFNHQNYLAATGSNANQSYKLLDHFISRSDTQISRNQAAFKPRTIDARGKRFDLSIR